MTFKARFSATPAPGVLTISLNLVSQLSHVGWGYLLVTAPVLLIGHQALWWTAGVCVLGEGIKEYADSHGLEDAATAGNSWLDLLWWLVGNATGVAVLLIAQWLHRV